MKLILNILKNGIGAFTGSLIGLNVLDASVAVWKQAGAAGLGAILLGIYNWSTPATALGKFTER
jgi:hypothetical protein